MRPLLLLAALVAAPALAQTPGSCETGTAQAFLDASGVQASLFNTGALFFGGSTTSGDGYLVPKRAGTSPIFAAALWIAGTVDGEVRASHARYGRYQMWPGPLDAGATLPDPTDCSAYDRIWTVSTYDLAIYEQTGEASADLADWPVGLGAPAVDANGTPLETADRGRTLDLEAGERPVISGTQTAFWVMNDVGNVHTEFQDRVEVEVPPLGVEVAVTAFAITSDVEALNTATVYRYAVTNRTASPILDARIGFFADVDLGNASDDYVGVDTTRGLAFVYNDSDSDANYGDAPPAAGFDLISGMGTSAPAVKYREARTAVGAYNQLRGLWPDGTPITEMGLGYQTDGPTTRFGFAGDPVTEAFWSEVNTDGAGANAASGDRHLVLASPPIDLAPAASTTITLAIVFGRGTDHLDSITELRASSDRVQAAYDDGSLFETTASTPLLAAPTLRAPADGARFFREPVLLSWDAVPGVERYRVEQSLDPAFPDPAAWYVDSTSTFGGFRSPLNEPETGYWRVRAESRSQRSPFSETREVTSYFYTGSVRRLPDGAPAYVEVATADGDDPCGPDAVSPDGCDAVAGNLVYRSLNSTGTYYFSEASGGSSGSETTLPTYAPNDFEIRFTDAGGLATYVFQENEIIRVPFEIWDIGMVVPGGANDPTDDVRLIPVLLADNGGTCAFDAAEIPEGNATLDGYVESDRIYAHYPTTSYADYEAQFAPLVDAEPDGCYVDTEEQTIDLIEDRRALQRQVFGSRAEAPALPGTGTVIRMYTDDPLAVAGEASPLDAAVALGAPYPNPAATMLRVPFALGAPADVRLSVFDVLGREVATLVDETRAAGTHEATLAASALAPGVYVVRLQTGAAAASTRITVVR